MRSGLLSLAVGAAVSVVVASPARADDLWERVETTLWSAELPVTWSKAGKAAVAGKTTWEFASPGRNYVLRVTVAPDVGGDFKALAAANIAKMKSRITGAKMLGQAHSEADGRPTYHAFLQGQMTRKKNKYDFLTLRFFSRLKRKSLFSLALSAKSTRTGDFAEVAKRVLGTLQLWDKSRPTPAAQRGKVGGQ